MLALFAQRLLDYLREKKQRRVQLFMALMTTRATPLNPDHVNALNSIDVVFSRKQDEKIRAAWETVRKYLENPSVPNWETKVSDLKADLYREIAVRVGYGDFTAQYLKYEIYLPKYYSDMEGDQLKIRQALTSALTGDGLKIIPGNVAKVSPPAETSAQGSQVPSEANAEFTGLGAKPRP